MQGHLTIFNYVLSTSTHVLDMRSSIACLAAHHDQDILAVGLTGKGIALVKAADGCRSDTAGKLGHHEL